MTETAVNIIHGVQSSHQQSILFGSQAYVHHVIEEVGPAISALESLSTDLIASGSMRFANTAAIDTGAGEVDSEKLSHGRKAIFAWQINQGQSNVQPKLLNPVPNCATGWSERLRLRSRERGNPSPKWEKPENSKTQVGEDEAEAIWRGGSSRKGGKVASRKAEAGEGGQRWWGGGGAAA
eukprot:c26969_g3_i1 orf=3-539(-)